MSPIRLADFDSDSDRSESPSFSQDDSEFMGRDCFCGPTYPRTDGKWAIDDEVNEPVVIVGIDISTSLSLFTEDVYWILPKAVDSRELSNQLQIYGIYWRTRSPDTDSFLKSDGTSTLFITKMEVTKSAVWAWYVKSSPSLCSFYALSWISRCLLSSELFS